MVTTLVTSGCACDMGMLIDYSRGVMHVRNMMDACS